MANSDSGYQTITGDYPLPHGTLLPAGSSEGEPLTFNANTPRPVIVDPGQPDGDFLVNYAHVTQLQKDYNAAARTAEAQANPVEFLRGRMRQGVSPAVPLKPQPAPHAEPAPHAALTSSRGLRFLDSDVGLPPAVDVYFEIPLGGTVAAKYHALIRSGSSLLLVYDTRFTTGFQYVPPVLQEHRLRVTAPQLAVASDCFSLGLQFSLGCFECVLLLVPEPSREEK